MSELDESAWLAYKTDVVSVALRRGGKRTLTYELPYKSLVVLSIMPDDSAGDPSNLVFTVEAGAITKSGTLADGDSVLKFVAPKGSTVKVTLLHNGGFFSKPGVAVVRVELRARRDALELRDRVFRALDSLKSYGAQYYRFYRDEIDAVINAARNLLDYLDDSAVSALSELEALVSSLSAGAR